MMLDAVIAEGSQVLTTSDGAGVTRCEKLTMVEVGVSLRQWGLTSLVRVTRRILWFFQAATSCGRDAASSTSPL